MEEQKNITYNGMNNGQYKFKIIVIGNEGIGKTTLINKFVKGTYSSSYDVTLGVEFATKIIKISDKDVLMHIWDTAGQESFRSLISSYFRDAQGVLLCYDVSNYKSFTDTEKWLNDVKSLCPTSVSIMLVGLKNDINMREVSFEQGNAYAEENSLLFMELSSKKDDINLASKCFHLLGNQIMNNFNVFVDGYVVVNAENIVEDGNKCCAVM